MSARLKEQDPLIKLIRSFIIDNHDGVLSMTVEEAFATATTLVAEHAGADPADGQTRLQRYAPQVHRMFCPLDLTRALHEVRRRRAAHELRAS